MMNYESINLFSEEKIKIERLVRVYFVNNWSDRPDSEEFWIPAGSTQKEAEEEAKKRLSGRYYEKGDFTVSTVVVKRYFSPDGLTEDLNRREYLQNFGEEAEEDYETQRRAWWKAFKNSLKKEGILL